MKEVISLVLLLWSVLFSNVVEPFVQKARTAFEDASAEAGGLDERWEDLGVSTSVVAPVDVISDVCDLSLDIPENLKETFSLTVGAGVDPQLWAPGDQLQESIATTGNDILLSSIVRKVRVKGRGGICSTQLRVSNAETWGEGEGFYVTVRLIGPKGERTSWHTERMSAQRLPVWVLNMAEVNDIAAPWRGRARIVAHDEIVVDDESSSSDHQIRVDVLNVCRQVGEDVAGLDE